MTLPESWLLRGPDNHLLWPDMGESRRDASTGDAFELVRGISGEWWCQRGRETSMGP